MFCHLLNICSTLPLIHVLTHISVDSHTFDSHCCLCSPHISADIFDVLEQQRIIPLFSSGFLGKFEELVLNWIDCKGWYGLFLSGF